MAYRYRDTKTGRFAKKATWKKSKKQGGKRYKREPVRQLKEWFVSLSYTGKRPRDLDFFVIAATRERVIPLIYDRIQNGKDDNGFDLTWAQRVPWEESDIDEIETKNSRIKKRSRERVEVH